MHTTVHNSLTSLFKTIKEEKLEQFAVITEDKENNIKAYILSRPFVKPVEDAQ